MLIFDIYVFTIFKGYNGGYGSAGLGLGPRYRNGGMKGPKQGRNIPTVNVLTNAFRLLIIPQTVLTVVKISGYGAAAGVRNGQGAKPNAKHINKISNTIYHIHCYPFTW